MREERTRSASRGQGSHHNLKKTKNRQPPARDEVFDSPKEDFVHHHLRGQQFSVCETSFHRHLPRGRTAHQFSDDFVTKADIRDLDQSKASKSESEYDHRESPVSTRGTSEQSYDRPIRANSPESGYAHETDSRSREYEREQHKPLRKDRLRRSWQTDAYEDAFSGRTGSKSHSSTGSGSSYSSSSDDEEFQLNASCMNALFNKDTERASNLIRCDKAGPSATEVQLKMTLPLPIQLMDGLDHLVPTKREVRSAIKSLKIQSGKIAKNCDFDYNRLDEQVIDEEFAGYAMPHFYKSLFEAPTELSSEGDESSSRERSTTNVALKNSKESAFLVTHAISNPIRMSQQKYSNGDSAFRPGSLPSQVIIEDNSSMFSSHDSLGMLSFGKKKQKKTLRLQCDSNGGSQCPAEGNVDSSGMQFRSLGQAAWQTSVEPVQHVLARQSGIVERIHQSYIPRQSRGKRSRLPHESSVMIQDNPSFDEGNPPSIISDIGTSKDSLKSPLDQNNWREKNALPKFNASFNVNLLQNKEWITARKLNLDFVDNINASFEAPDDEAPKVSCDRGHGVPTERIDEKTQSLVEGVPNSVDYGRKMTDKDIRTVYSDLTVDEEYFEKDEFQTVSFSNQRTNLAAELALPHRNMRTEDAATHPHIPAGYATESSYVKSHLPFSGDELMGTRGDLDHPTQGGLLRDSVLLPMGHFTDETSIEMEAGPMDEISRKGTHELPSHDTLRIANADFDALCTVSLLNQSTGKDDGGDMSLASQRIRPGALSSALVTPLSQHVPGVQNQKHGGAQLLDTDVAVSVMQKEGKQSSESTNASSDEGEVPMDERRSGGSPSLPQSPMPPSSQEIEELRIPVRHVRRGAVEQSDSSEQNSSQVIEEGHEGFPLKTCRTLANFLVHDRAEINEGGTAQLAEDLMSVDFSNRLKLAAAARLDAMNTTPILNSHMKGESISVRESCRHQGREPWNRTTSGSHSGEPITSSDFRTVLTTRHKPRSGDASVISKEPSLNGETTQQDAKIVQEMLAEASILLNDSVEDCDVFLDTADPDDCGFGSVSNAIARDSQGGAIHFISEIDARSQAVEINYIGGNVNMWTDSQSLVTEPQLVLAPTTTTLGTSLASAPTLFTMDTPVRDPSAIFDHSDGKEAYRAVCPQKAYPELTFVETDESNDEDRDYHFDERHARLAALLPASQLKTTQRIYPTPLIIVKNVTKRLGSILLIALSWLKHLMHLHQRKTLLASRWIEGEPNFRGWMGTKHESPPTTRQRIQGTRAFRSEMRQMEGEEAGILIEFVVPDVHRRLLQHPIWTVPRAQKSRRSQNLEETYATLCASFSRKDVRSVAHMKDMKGWPTKPAHSNYDFVQE